MYYRKIDGGVMKNNYTYPAKIKRTEEEIVLEFLDFPNVISTANSEEEIIEIAQEVLALSILDCIDQGKEPPRSSIVEKGAVYVHIWLPYYKNIAKEVKMTWGRLYHHHTIELGWGLKIFVQSKKSKCLKKS